MHGGSVRCSESRRFRKRPSDETRFWSFSTVCRDWNEKSDRLETFRRTGLEPGTRELDFWTSKLNQPGQLSLRTWLGIFSRSKLKNHQFLWWGQLKWTSVGSAKVRVWILPVTWLEIYETIGSFKIQLHGIFINILTATPQMNHQCLWGQLQKA